MSDQIEELRRDVVFALRGGVIHGFHEGVDNHFSVALPDGRLLINSYGKHWSELTPEDILEVADDGTVLSGRGHWDRAAFTIHRAVHQARPDVVAVFHTHQPYATAVANTAEGLDTRLVQSAMLFHGHVSYVDYAGIARTQAEGDQLRSAVKDDGSIAVLMRNHGVMTVGANLAEAWYRLYFLERASQAQVLAYSTGRELVRVTEETAASTAAQWHEAEAGSAATLFAALRREVVREDPKAADWLPATGRVDA
ncbi:ribulose-5-phosphate 4-epimerase/fuculose-1-phosphate aldolase [Streptacidiphilus sp. MAP12-33]|uniref:class II aldolase/adducin family protein n=1 Tax=Streptacidiphilus sp. MAP12-33 TaxID=3156266 RepID=UPI003516742F